VVINKKNAGCGISPRLVAKSDERNVYLALSFRVKANCNQKSVCWHTVGCANKLSCSLFGFAGRR
jgi:hypothetical protein